MREATGDLFEYPADAIVIPTNLCTRFDGTAVMGAGVAKEAANRWPALPAILGQDYRDNGPGLYWHEVWNGDDGTTVVCFPTKNTPSQRSSLKLIERSCRQLVDLMAMLGRNTSWGWQTVALPRVGCGLGGLDWATQVRPLLDGLLDERFVVVNRGRS